MNNKKVNFKKTSTENVIARTQSEAIQKASRFRIKCGTTTLLGKIAMVFVFCFLLSAHSFAQNPGGTVGALTWELNLSDSIFTIDGNDIIPDYTSPPPWWAYHWSIAKIVIGDSVKSIGRMAFSTFQSATSINIGNSVTEIKESAFNVCVRVTSLTLGSSVTTIESYAFAGCPLTSVTIPASVTTIGDYAFGGFGTNIDSVICKTNTPPIIFNQSFCGYTMSENGLAKITVYVPCSSIVAYQMANYWKVAANYQAIGGVPLPDVPENVAVLQKDNALEISWESAGAVSYEIYRNNALLTTTTLTTYRDSNLTNNVNYCYKINAVGDSCVSGFSSEVCKKFTSDVGITNYELRNTNYAIYPNPTDGKLIIESGELKIENVEIFDIYGRKLSHFTFHDSSVEIDISHLTNGMYYLRIDGKTMKLVKE